MEYFDVEKYKKRIMHIKAHIEAVDVDMCIDNIVSNKGNRPASVLALSSHHKAVAIYSWFADGSLDFCRANFHISALLRKMWYEIQEEELSPGYNMFELLQPLLSIDLNILSWFVSANFLYNKNKIEDETTVDFYAYQAILALRGERGRLIERCEKVCANPPKSPELKNFMIDHQFYLALARGDVEKMELVISNLVSKKNIKARSGGESGYTEGLISTVSTIYCKIARFNGYEVRVESPYVPSDWLAMEPLKSYERKYEFLK